MKSKIILNSSMPRSGSELLQAILQQHPDIQASSTSPLLEYLFASNRSLKETEEALSQEDSEEKFKAFARAGVNAYCDAYLKEKKGAKVYLDKSRGWIYYKPLIESILGEAPKTVCMVRDLPEIVASMERLHREAPLLEGNPMEMVTTQERVNNWITKAPIGLAARRVLNAIGCSYNNILFVKYEDLCSKPQEILKEVLSHFGLKSFNFDLNKIKKASLKENDTVFGYKNIHGVESKIRPAFTSANQVLGEGLAEGVRRGNQAYQSIFGYSTGSTGSVDENKT